MLLSGSSHSLVAPPQILPLHLLATHTINDPTILDMIEHNKCLQWDNTGVWVKLDPFHYSFILNYSIKMDSKYTSEMFKHLEKQSEVLMDTYRSMSHELHRLQVEEEMLMRKFYELMAAQGLTKKNENRENIFNDGGNGQSGASVSETSGER